MANPSKKITILDEDLLELTNGVDVVKNSELMKYHVTFLTDNDLYGKNGNYFKPPSWLKALFKEVGAKTSNEMHRTSLLKLYGGDARDAGLVEYD